MVAYYYPQSKEEKNIYLLHYSLLKNIESYKLLLARKRSEREKIVTEIKMQHISIYLKKINTIPLNDAGKNDWQSIRNRIIKRDGNQCVLCGTKRTPFYAHHIHYRAHGGDDDPTNLITVCKRCHESFPQHTLVSEYMKSDRNCYQRNLNIILSHINKNNPKLINKLIFEDILSYNPLIDNEHFRFTKSDAYMMLFNILIK